MDSSVPPWAHLCTMFTVQLESEAPTSYRESVPSYPFLPPRVRQMKKSSVCVLVVCLTLVAHTASAQGGRGDLRRNSRAVPNQYIVVLAGGDDPLAVALQAQTLHGGRLKHVYRNVLHG